MSTLDDVTTGIVISDHPVVDVISAKEFLKEATKTASADDLRDSGALLSAKHALFKTYLSASALPNLDEEGLGLVFRQMFSVRRPAQKLLAKKGLPFFKEQIDDLLYGDEALPQRFDRFVSAMSELGPMRGEALASELLHFNQPHRYWMWTKWIWDPKEANGAIRLLTQDGVPLTGDSPGQSYLNVGRAIAQVTEQSLAIGSQSLGRGVLGTDVLLAATYAVYMRTLYTLRLSEDFNKFLPPLNELIRRLLGVKRIEAEGSPS